MLTSSRALSGKSGSEASAIPTRSMRDAGARYCTTRTSACGEPRQFDGAVDRIFDESDLVHQAVLFGLQRGEDLARRQVAPVVFQPRRRGSVDLSQLRPPRFHDLLEVLERFVHIGLDDRPVFLRHGARRTENLFAGMAADRVIAHVVAGHQPAQVVMGHDDADRTGRRRGLREDRLLLVADRHRDVVSAAGRNAPHADHQRQVAFFAELLQVVVDVVGARDRAAGRIDRARLPL